MQANTYIKVSLSIVEMEHELLVAMLSAQGYYAFEEKSGQLDGYIMREDFSEESLKETLSNLYPESRPDFTIEEIEHRDWNQEWEDNFQPVTIGDFCQIRPDFKTASDQVKFDLIIQPKMSFGTGHHHTTRMMVELASGISFDGKKVMDMGCGTGVLGILATKMGAKEVLGIDIDEWCYENTMENIELNRTTRMKVIHGGADAIPDVQFDVIFANINRNILLSDGIHYAKHLPEGGKLLLSGFFDFDEKRIIDYFKALNFVLEKRLESEGWIAMELSKDKN